MKTRFTLLAVLMVAFSAMNAQQVSNGGLEDWTGNIPNNWHTVDEFLNTYGEASGHVWVSKETDPLNVNGGLAAAKITTQTSSLASNNAFYGILNIGGLPINSTLNGPQYLGAPISSRPDTLFFATKYKPVGNDTAAVGFYLTRWNAGVREKLSLAGPGQFYKMMPDTAYTSFYLLPNYQSAATPDTIGLTFLSSGGSTTLGVGSALWIDDVELAYSGISTDVENLAVNTRISMFPVPAKATLNVSVSEAMLNNTYSIIDLNGRVISKGIVTNINGKYDVSSFASGTYIYTILDSQNKTINQAKFTVAR